MTLSELLCSLKSHSDHITKTHTSTKAHKHNTNTRHIMSTSQSNHQQQLVYASRMDRDAGSYQVERVSHPRRYSQPDHQYDDYRRSSHESRGERYHEPQKSRRNENPAMTVWRETYELWDGVLEVVGKAWFKMGGK